MMTVLRSLPRLLAGVMFMLAVGATDAALAQRTLSNPNPTPGSIALAKELLTLKGGPQMFDNMVPNVINETINQFIPTNPQLSKPINEVAAQLRTEFEP